MTDLTWTMMRVDRRTPTLRNGRHMQAMIDRGWEHVSRKGEARGPNETAGTAAIVPWEPHPCQRVVLQ